MRFSVVVTVKNEAHCIQALLDSLARQLKKPEEIILVDGGSTDKTLEIVRDWKKMNPGIVLEIIEAKGLNRSQGRNLGIKHAVCEKIAVTDAGCIVDKKWLQKIEEVWEKNESKKVVAGFYLVEARNILEYTFGLMLAVNPVNVKPDKFLPSSRSIAFEKEFFEKIGGYPENLETCEDLVLAAKFRKSGEMVMAPSAVVYWYMPADLFLYIKQVASYATGDVKARYEPHVFKIVTTFLRYFLFVLYPPLFLLYLLVYPSVKHFNRAWRNGSLLLLPVVQLATDVGVMCGALGRK